MPFIPTSASRSVQHTTDMQRIFFMMLQANGLILSPGNVVVVAITATLAAIGSASIPNSALVSMVTVLQVPS